MAAPITLVTLARPSGLDELVEPGLAKRLTVPVDVLGGAVFRADDELSLIRRPDGAPLLRFGVGRLKTFLCMDPSSGEVLTTDDEAWLGRVGVRLDWREGFVNSDVARFVETARVVSATYPFYSRAAFDTEDGIATVQRLCDELVRLIGEIDPPAMMPDRFWSTFTDDVRIGDFATEEL